MWWSVAGGAVAVLAGLFAVWRLLVRRANRRCVFCEIAAGKRPADRVPGFASDELEAFRDIHPGGRVHVLVVPKRHVASDVYAVREARLLERMGEAGQQVLRLLGEDGERGRTRMVFVRPPFNTVFHLHLHVLVDEHPSPGNWLHRVLAVDYPALPLHKAIRRLK